MFQCMEGFHIHLLSITRSFIRQILLINSVLWMRTPKLKEMKLLSWVMYIVYIVMYIVIYTAEATFLPRSEKRSYQVNRFNLRLYTYCSAWLCRKQEIIYLFTIPKFFNRQSAYYTTANGLCPIFFSGKRFRKKAN